MPRILIILLLLWGNLIFSQEKTTIPFSIDAQYFYGTLLRHNKNVAHIVTEHPEGFILSYSRKTFGEKRWQRVYGFPDWGFSLMMQNFKSDILGKTYGIYAHYNFYLLNRNIQLRVAQGIAYNTNPFDFDDNFKNIAYGSHILESFYVLLNYNKQNIYKGIGLQGGVCLVHHSNGSLKSPNSGTNIFSFNLGLQYHFMHDQSFTYTTMEDEEKIKEPIKYNFVLRGGVNESDFLGLGQYPFAVVSAFVDKRLSYISTIQLGVDAFFSKFLEKEIEYVSKSFPSRGVKGDEDYKRIGVFAGHEFRLGDVGFITQVGYYIYYPYNFESRVYSRLGVKYYITDAIFGVVSVKSHSANAEAIEFGIGVRI